LRRAGGECTNWSLAIAGAGMGTLRTFLALVVTYGHFGSFAGFAVLNGEVAVQTFYLISGFYMSLVLNGKYRDASAGTFFMSRLLRLYPVYLIVLAASVVIAPKALPDVSIGDMAFFVGSHVLLFLRDLHPFLEVRDGAIHFTTNLYAAGDHALPAYSYVRQSWSIGVELWFYLLAPFVLRRGMKWLIALLAISVANRLIIQFGFGLADDPWSYRFFPNELAVFMLGAIAQHSTRDRKAFGILAACSVAFCIVKFIAFHGQDARLPELIFFLLVSLLLPSLFDATKRSVVDRYAGELSYPLYLVHMIFFGSGILLTPNLMVGAQIAFISSILVAIIIAVCVEIPLDKWRQRFIGSRLAIDHEGEVALTISPARLNL
jgi:peptidoglycan/LPS O-acetylase OafA/YrhL